MDNDGECTDGRVPNVFHLTLIHCTTGVLLKYTCQIHAGLPFFITFCYVFLSFNELQHWLALITDWSHWITVYIVVLVKVYDFSSVV